MNTDQTKGAGAYKADHRDDAAPPPRLRLNKDRPLEFGYREAAIAAGALGLGYLAFKGVNALLDRSASGKPGALKPEPLARSSGPDVKDNAAPRFAGEGANRAPGAPFLAASDADDTGDLLVDVTEMEVAAAASPSGRTDQSARAPEHAPTDLMGDAPPGPNDRAIDAFRPDATAPVPPEMRESLRPATGSAPGFAANRGDFASGLSQTDGSK